MFDSTQVHEINILMSAENYKSMLDTYSETSEKERFKTDVIIDWVTIHDVWVRLKWNSTLWWFGGWWWPGWDMDENFKKMFENIVAKMDSLSPLKTLSRGYSIIQKENNIKDAIKSAGKIKRNTKKIWNRRIKKS